MRGRPMSAVPALCLVVLACLACLALTACEPVVYKQTVPVSSNPLGAEVIVDGSTACTTPCQVELARNQDHVLTVVKQGYRQEDVVVTRRYDESGTMMRAFSAGYNDAQFFNNPAWGVQSGVNSMDSQKQTGQAYTLQPSTVSVQLVPKAGIGPAVNQPNAPSAQPGVAAPAAPAAPVVQVDSALELMQSVDRDHLNSILERQPSGTDNTWVNPDTGYSFRVVPEPARDVQGWVVRDFQIAATGGGYALANTFPAFRQPNGMWQLGLPAAPYQQGQPAEQYCAQPFSPAMVGLAAGAVATTALPEKSTSKTWTDSHTSTSTSVKKDGTVVQKKTTTSTSATVGVNPAGVGQALGKLLGE